jgi:hypothetical protein
MVHNVAVRIWDPRWLTMWLCAFGIPDGSQCGCAHLGSHMAHNVCCDSYHVHNVTYIYYTIVYLYWGSSTWRVLACCFLGPLFTDWAPGLLCPLWLYWFSCFVVFRRLGGASFHLFFVVCYCFLFWIRCVLSSSASMKSDHLCSAIAVWVLRRA